MEPIKDVEYPDIYFLPEWGKLYEEHDHAKVDKFNFRCDKGHVYYQFMKRRLPEELECSDYVDLVTPYGFSGPVIIECPSGERQALVRDFDEAFQQYCQREKIVSEYVRFNPWLKNHEDFAGFYELKYNKYTLFTDLTGNDFFMEEFGSKTRNQIRKAQKSNVTIDFDFSGATIDTFNRLYELTAAKNDFHDYYRFTSDFLEKTFQALSGRQFIINAFHGGECISSAIFLVHHPYIHYHLCANDPRFYSLCANSLILYEAGKWGRINGIRQMHLGGAFTDELFAFKKQFSKNGICDYFVGKKIRDKSQYGILLELKNRKGGIRNSDYFPLYRG